MSAESADRVRRHRLRQAGYEGRPCPAEVVGDFTDEGKELTQAWAEGVARRQAEQAQAARSKREPRPK
jgi:hypothetical protein